MNQGEFEAACILQRKISRLEKEIEEITNQFRRDEKALLSQYYKGEDGQQIHVGLYIQDEELAGLLEYIEVKKREELDEARRDFEKL